MVWYDRSQLAVAIAIVATILLHVKTELHGLSEKFTQQDLASILQFAVLTFIVLPLLPNQGFGPYQVLNLNHIWLMVVRIYGNVRTHRVLNPDHIWLMVVLVSGLSLAGYLALRLIGGGKSLLLVGAFGGLVSSTATTLVYARQAKQFYNSGQVEVSVTVTTVGIAFMAATASKLLTLAFVGNRPLLKRCGPALMAPAIGVVIGLLLFT